MLPSLALFALVKASPVTKRAAPAGVPQYVLDYAPVVRLYSADPYRPSDIGNTLPNTAPEVNFSPVANVANPLTLDNLDSLNGQGGADVYLTSKQDVTTNPAWLNGVVPDGSGSTGSATTSTVVVVDKGNGVVDAFYLYFFANNWGGTILNFNVGNHVGDWEHNVVRFNNGQPDTVWYSQHSNGEAFRYSAVDKEGIRPVVFSSNGSHANYATVGTQDRVLPDLDLPGFILNDFTDEGPKWDPVLNSYFYKYDVATGAFDSYDGVSPTGWLRFEGKWGDKQYPDSDPKQKNLLGLARKFTDGPTGPRDKGLNRKNICPDSDSFCFVRGSLSTRDVGEEIW
ncbi:Vps62-like protein 1 [Elsinoe fawcettii]|nr:Vps62-like protein 1 [Elsinoe fawcettii]